MNFPHSRPQRLRSTALARNLVAETALSPDQLVAPLFVKESLTDPEPIPTMPGVSKHSIRSLRKEAEELLSAGVRAVILFGIPKTKDPEGSEASDRDGIVQRAVMELADAFGSELLISTDLCLDEFTDHGHCGVLGESGAVDNDATLERYAEIAISQATAGSGLIAPSGMMDGQVGAIRGALDSAGFKMTPIMAYSVKFASAFYGPFRDAAECAPAFGDRRSYQMDYRNRGEAVREALLDEDEGADILMVKPAGHYLDIISDIKAVTTLPVAAYQVSGEYSALKAATEAGYLDAEPVMIESLTAIRRAGANLIITYFAKDAARALS
ncbi:MAG: porphobilinogen synthase [Acidobacteria bacterium]|nr:MAG: porphobilinogen synthase [Acidobacteriota bacterium]